MTNVHKVALCVAALLLSASLGACAETSARSSVVVKRKSNGSGPILIHPLIF